MPALAGLVLAVGAQIGTGAPQPITGIENALPAWSPDGTRIAFTRRRGRSMDIWVMPVSG